MDYSVVKNSTSLASEESHQEQSTGKRKRKFKRLEVRDLDSQ